jgi:hypothetical protein
MQCDTINYEIMSTISSRVPRVFLNWYINSSRLLNTM